MANEDPAVASVTVSGSTMTVKPEAGGSTTIEVAATDPEGLSARLTFPVSVREPVPGAFDLDVVIVGEATELQRQAFEDAALCGCRSWRTRSCRTYRSTGSRDWAVPGS